MSTYTNYLKLRKFINQTYPNVIVSIKLYNIATKHLYLHKILVPKQYKNCGIGTQIMNFICNFCDEEKIDCFLQPTNYFGSNLERLINFYVRFNFKFYDNDDEMIRKFKI